MEKYYIVPANLFESNNPDDVNSLVEQGVVATFSSEKDIVDVASDLNEK